MRVIPQDSALLDIKKSTSLQSCSALTSPIDLDVNDMAETADKGQIIHA